jgi:hypothetical protein
MPEMENSVMFLFVNLQYIYLSCPSSGLTKNFNCSARFKFNPALCLCDGSLKQGRSWNRGVASCPAGRYCIPSALSAGRACVTAKQRPAIITPHCCCQHAGSGDGATTALISFKACAGFAVHRRRQSRGAACLGAPAGWAPRRRHGGDGPAARCARCRACMAA